MAREKIVVSVVDILRCEKTNQVTGANCIVLQLTINYPWQADSSPYFMAVLPPLSHLQGRPMTNNDILRRIRYTFDFSDSKIISIFKSADYPVTRSQISDWLKKDDDPAHQKCSDMHLALFLNGLINERRGKKEGPQPGPEKRLNNNLILLKLKIALNLKSDDTLELMELAGFRMSEHELSAFFRKPGHKHYRKCKDQILRNFLQGMQLKYRPQRKPFVWPE